MDLSFCFAQAGDIFSSAVRALGGACNGCERTLGPRNRIARERACLLKTVPFALFNRPPSLSPPTHHEPDDNHQNCDSLKRAVRGCPRSLARYAYDYD
jgi:hypothetical protein